MLSSSNMATGAASVRCSRGVTISSELQNRRMPILHNAMIPANPDPNNAAHNAQVEADAGSSRAVPSAAADDSDPEGDIHASADYRRKMVRVFVRRALEEAASRVGKGS